MDKREFLKELEKYLDILEEQEQQDILNEYSQHIEMKMKKGMSEEEAIEDFGDVEVLAGDILSAYHIKLQEKAMGGRNIHKIAEEGKKAVHGTFTAVKGMACKMWRRLKKLVKAPFTALQTLWKKMPHFEKQDKVQGDGINMEKHGFMKGAKSFFTGLWDFCIRAFCWCVRWCFNIALMLVAAFTGIITLLCLFCVGTLFVLLAAGYPLIGVTLACFGGLLMCGAFTVLIALLIRFKKEVAVDAQ